MAHILAEVMLSRVVRDGSAPGRSFAVVLPDGREAMALFNSEDEARVFCQFGEEGANLGIRETSTAEGKSHLKVLYGYSPPLRGGRFIYCG